MSNNQVDSFKEELKQFILNNYVHSISEQFQKPKQDQIYEINLTLDLSLIIDTRPLLGSWIINFYPTFLLSIHQIIYSIVEPLNIGYDEFICQIKFISVPTFDTAIHDPAYKLILLQKCCGSLIHIKNSIIVGVDQPKNYLFLQEFICKCSNKVFVKGSHLIQRLQGIKFKEICPECQNQYIEISKSYKLCQRLEVAVNDLQPTSRKFNNLKINEYGKYKHSFQILDIFIDGNNVNKFKVGQQIYSLSYYTNSFCETLKQKKLNVIPNEYCYAISIDNYTAILNKKYFQKIRLQYKFTSSQQINPQENYNDEIRDLLLKSRRHYNYDKNNKQYIFEITNTIFYLILSYNKQNNCVLQSESLFSLRLSFIMSIFLENSQNLQYYLQPTLCQKSNLLIQRLESEQIQKHLNIGVIYEDHEIVMDLIHDLTDNLENCYILPDCDEITFDHLIINVCNNGILILQRMPIKSIQQKIIQIMKGNQITLFKDKKISINCSIWCLFNYQDLKFKHSEFIYLKEKYPQVSDLFDIVIDISQSNLITKQVRCNLAYDLCQSLQCQFKQQSFHQMQTTIKKTTSIDKSVGAPSSCYILQKKTVEKICNSELETWMNKLLNIDRNTIEMINQFYLKLRQNTGCIQNTLHSLIKISVSISIMRNFLCSQIDESEGLYQYLCSTANQSPLTYADGLLSILLIIETRINSLGPAGALFGSDTTNYLMNGVNPQFTFNKLINEEQKENNNPLFASFEHIYDKIMNYIY